MISRGLNSKEVAESRQKHGANTLTQIPPDPLWKKILEGFKDPMIMILLVALIVQVVLFFLKQAEWFEPVGILIAILIANGVASISESSQESKASALREASFPAPSPSARDFAARSFREHRSPCTRVFFTF